MSDAVAAIGLLVGVIRELRAAAKTGLNDNVTRALHQIRFSPQGVLSLLHAIEHDEDVSNERIAKVLPNFNDQQWKLEAAIGRLHFAGDLDDLRLSLRTKRLLGEIAYHKTDVRHAVQTEINRFGQPGARRPSKQRVRKLIRAIQELNDQIEAVEERVNLRIQERPAGGSMIGNEKAKAKTKAKSRR